LNDKVNLILHLFLQVVKNGCWNGETIDEPAISGNESSPEPNVHFAVSFMTTTKKYYLCAGCNLPLFRSDAKFDSGNGLPIFFSACGRREHWEGHGCKLWNEANRNSLHSLHSHLGHVSMTVRAHRITYCINSESLNFQKMRWEVINESHK